MTQTSAWSSPARCRSFTRGVFPNGTAEELDICISFAELENAELREAYECLGKEFLGAEFTGASGQEEASTY